MMWDFSKKNIFQEDEIFLTMVSVVGTRNPQIVRTVGGREESIYLKNRTNQGLKVKPSLWPKFGTKNC